MAIKIAETLVITAKPQVKPQIKVNFKEGFCHHFKRYNIDIIENNIIKISLFMLPASI